MKFWMALCHKKNGKSQFDSMDMIKSGDDIEELRLI